MYEGFYIKGPNFSSSKSSNKPFNPSSKETYSFHNLPRKCVPSPQSSPSSTSALLASAQAVPQGQAAPQVKAASQACWKCPSDQGLYKFQQQTGGDPLHCQFLKDGMTYYCDYKSVCNDSPHSYNRIIY
jgi:hypothetical protein